MQKQSQGMSDLVFYSLAAFIILIGVVVVGYILLNRSDSDSDDASVAANDSDSVSESSNGEWSPGCEAVNTVVETPRSLLVQDGMAVVLSLTSGAKAFTAGEIVNVEGISSPLSTSWMHFLQINRVMPDGTIEYQLAHVNSGAYPDSDADVLPLIASYEIPEDGEYNFQSDLIFWERRSANEGIFRRAWCERAES